MPRQSKKNHTPNLPETPAVSESAPTPSRVEVRHFFSASLGIPKRYTLYLPEGYDQSAGRFPVVYLLRGHEREWFNPNEDHTRNGQTIKHIADRLIAEGSIGKTILIGPSMSSDDGGVPAVGVNCLRPEAVRVQGIGTGKFEDYFTQDLIAHIDATCKTHPNRLARAIDGFSLGGYMAVMYGVKHPDLFGSVGSYDGTHMWLDFDDPRTDGEALPSDNTWTRGGMFDIAFGSPRNLEYMKNYNAANLARSATGAALRKLRGVAFHISSAANDGQRGNIDRTKHIVALLAKKGVKNSFDDVRLTSDAEHTWHCANHHISLTLRRHWAVFEAYLQSRLPQPEKLKRRTAPLSAV